MDDIPTDKQPEETSAPGQAGEKRGRRWRLVGPESEVRGGSEAPDDVLSDPGEKP